MQTHFPLFLFMGRVKHTGQCTPVRRSVGGMRKYSRESNVSGVCFLIRRVDNRFNCFLLRISFVCSWLRCSIFSGTKELRVMYLRLPGLPLVRMMVRGLLITTRHSMGSGGRRFFVSHSVNSFLWRWICMIGYANPSSLPSCVRISCGCVSSKEVSLKNSSLLD